MTPMFKKSVFGLFPALLLALLFMAPVPQPAYADQLNVNAQTGTTYTLLNTDCSKLVTFNNAASVAVTLPEASSATGGGAGAGTFMPPCVISVSNLGVGAVTITPTTSTIGGNASLTLPQSGGAQIISDGTNYQVNLGVVGNTTTSTNTTTAWLGSTNWGGTTGAHTTVQEWLKVFDAAGIARYIPLF